MQYYICFLMESSIKEYFLNKSHKCNKLKKSSFYCLTPSSKLYFIILSKTIRIAIIKHNKLANGIDQVKKLNPILNASNTRLKKIYNIDINKVYNEYKMNVEKSGQEGR